MMKSEEAPSLRDRVLKSLGDRALDVYQRAARYHYHHLRWHRKSDEKSLAMMRHILYDAGCLSALRIGGWRVDRSAEEVGPFLGLDLHEHTRQRVITSRSTGLEHPHKWLHMMDMGSGNGRMIYDLTYPGIIWSGITLELHYPLDGTLTNCVRAELRWRNDGTQESYLCPSFQSACDTLEMASTIAFVSEPNTERESRAADLFREFAELVDACNGTVNECPLNNLGDHARVLVDDWKEAIDRSRLMCAVIFKMLLDELIARCAFSNGMNFWYPSTCEFLRKAMNGSELELPPGWCAGFEKDLSELLRFAQMIVDKQAKQHTPLSTDQRAMLRRTATNVYLNAREYRLQFPEDYSGAVAMDISNELWKWLYFEHQADVGGYNLADPDRCITILRDWLDHPVAVLDRTDIDFIYRGLVRDDDGEFPAALVAILPFLNEKYPVFARESLGFPDVKFAEERLSIWLRRRMLLARARRQIRVVTIDEQKADDFAKVQTIIQTFVSFLYNQTGTTLIDEIDRRLEFLQELLLDNAWCRTVLRDDGKKLILSRKKVCILEEYAANPHAFLKLFFEFYKDEFDIRGRVDYFPPPAI